MVNVPSKNTLLFLQPLPPASPMLRPGAATSPIHSTTSSAGNPVDICAAPVDHRQRERPRPLEQPRYPRPHNPPFERSKGKRSLRPLKPPIRQIPKSYASVTTSVSVNPPPRPCKHRTCPHVLLSSQLWPIPSMSRGVINCVKQRLSHLLSRIKSIDQWAVDPDPFMTLTTSENIGKTAIPF